MDLFQKLSGRAFWQHTPERWEGLMCNIRTAEKPGVKWVVRCVPLSCVGKEEIQMIALALNKLPARTIWKLSQREVAAAGGLEALNLSQNVMVRSASTPCCSLKFCLTPFLLML